MISDSDIERVRSASAKFKPTVIGARYHAESDQIELRTEWCTLIVNRQEIDELRGVTPHNLEAVTVSAVGLHFDDADIDINAAGLLEYLGKKLVKQARKSI
ncbi:MAG TPA: DUF2442 domain-containing protein [Stellaceae bacterium]|nr:DUF2442 domain-containing protein [Stellaceae bacterium]